MSYLNIEEFINMKLVCKTINCNIDSNLFKYIKTIALLDENNLEIIRKYYWHQLLNYE